MIYDRDSIKEWAGDDQIRALRADLAHFRADGYTGWGTEGMWALAIFRLQKAVGSIPSAWLRTIPALLLVIFRKLFVIVTGVDIHPSCEIGPGLLLRHAAQIRIREYTKIGAGCSIAHLTTIGEGPKPGSATIGDHVHIACHVCILGPVRIGDGATISAGSLVISDVPAFHTAIGVPAKVLPAARDRRFGYSNVPAPTSAPPPPTNE